jgi:hypothetical protein
MRKLILFFLANLWVNGVYADRPANYVLGEIGFTQFNDFDNRITFPGCCETVTSNNIRNNSSTFKISLGTRWSEYLESELSYLKSNEANINYTVSDTELGNYRGNAKIRFHGIQNTWNVRPSISSGWNNVFPVIGIHATKVTYRQIETAPAGISGISVFGLGILYGLGYDANLDTSTKMRFSALKYSHLGGEGKFKADVITLGLIKSF